ncbi:hypothetical protein P3L10_020301 [Capsicum annuum]
MVQMLESWGIFKPMILFHSLSLLYFIASDYTFLTLIAFDHLHSKSEFEFESPSRKLQFAVPHKVPSLPNYHNPEAGAEANKLGMAHHKVLMHWPATLGKVVK